jgi:hypothetical protein
VLLWSDLLGQSPSNCGHYALPQILSVPGSGGDAIYHIYDNIHPPGTRSVRRENSSSFNFTMQSIVRYVAGFTLLAAQVLAYITSDGEVVIPGATSYNGLGLVPQMGFDNCRQTLFLASIFG